MGEPNSFDITWRGGAYRVSIPNYSGGTVYTAEYVARLTRENEAMRKALQFYADPRRYDGPNQRPIDGDIYAKPGSVYIQDVTRDNGEIARIALSLKDSAL